MKYAKKFKLVPYSTETPEVSQVATTFNNALTSNTFPDEKVKIYNQALSKIKELNPADTSIKKNTINLKRIMMILMKTLMIVRKELLKK